MKLQNGVICKGWNILRSFYHHDYATTKPSYLGSKLPITYDKYFSLCITINLTSVQDVDVKKLVCKCVAGVRSTLATYSTADTYTWVYLTIPGYTWTLTTVHLMSGGHPLVGFYPISPLDGVKIPNFHESTNGSMMNIVLEVKNIRYYFGLPFAPSPRCVRWRPSQPVCALP